MVSRFAALMLPSVAALLLVATPGRAQTSPPAGFLTLKGPLPYRDREPLNAAFLLPQPTDASILRSGRARLEARLEVVNDLLTNQDTAGHRYFTDFEEQRFYLSYNRGLGRRQEAGISLPFIARNGGFLDSFVNTWHKIFGFKGGGRGDIANNRTLFDVRNAAGQTILSSTEKTTGLGDMVLEYRFGLTELPEGAEKARTVAASVRALVKLPTGKSGPLFGSGATDAGIGLALTGRPDRRWGVHGNATLVLLGKPKNDALDARRSLVHSLLSAEYLLNGRWSLVAQTDNNPAPFNSGLSYPDRPRRSFTFGTWRQLNGANRLFFAFSENDFGPLAKHAPDFVMATGVQWGL